MWNGNKQSESKCKDCREYNQNGKCYVKTCMVDFQSACSEVESRSAIETIEPQGIEDNIRARDTKYLEWTEEEVENLKIMLKYIKEGLHKLYRR